MTVQHISDRPLPQPLRCAIFDLDGTLVDSLQDLADSIDAAFAQHGLPALGRERVSRNVGSGARRLVEKSLADVGAPPGRTDAVLASFAQVYDRNHLHHTHLYPEAAAMLERLHAQGVGLAVVSNKPYRFTRSLLEHLGVARFLSAVVGGDSLPQLKPHPAPLLHALEACGAAPDAAIMVGDGEHDMAAARAAGIYALGAAWGLRAPQVLVEAGADALAGSLAEVAELLAGPA